ncbi:MAG: Phenylalanine--tRNA ligase beta subunit [Chlamydiae bacterium]|nr:Phenylalanine--tRNA ligase beta subunit [Chlamydiota bacterium]
MKVPLSWLKDYIAIEQSPSEISEILTMLGLEVEAIESFSPSFTDVVVGKVVGSEKHPDADQLQIASVSDGEQVYQVVCAAPNCREGLVTAFCRIGGSLEEEDGKSFHVKKAKIRGVESFGMLCSGKELRVSEDYNRILELPDNFAVGSDLTEFYSDDILDIAITPNLGHCASMLGVARELSAALGLPHTRPEGHVKENSAQKIQDLATVKVHDVDLCPRYACRVIEGVKVRPSPMWLQQKLTHAGIRPVNNIVDVTNFVLMETGHPLHAFDFDRLEGGQIHVRKADAGEKIKTLDGKKRTLCEGFLLICDQSRPVALAGVMGGEETEVSEKTVNILLESAYFDPGTIRKASKHYGLSSDASRRFERGCDPNQVILSLERATSIIQEIAGGSACKGIIDVKQSEFEPQRIPCRVARTNEILGIQLSPGEIEEVFKRLGFHYTWTGAEILNVEVPTYRADVSGEIDLIEEVARIYGYDKIPKELALYCMSQAPHSPIFLFERLVRERIVAEGLQEILTCDLISPTQVALVEDDVIPKEFVIKVMNPTSIDQSVLRPSLMPGMLQVVKYNLDRQIQNLSLFEIGRIHFHEEEQYKEQSVAGIMMTGDVRPHHCEEKTREVDFYDLKGILENIMRSLLVGPCDFKTSDLHIFHPGRQASLIVEGVVVATLGELHPSITRLLDINQRVYYAEFNLHDLMQVRRTQTKMESIPQFPCSVRDWTVTMVEEEPVESVFKAVRSLDSKLLEDVQLIVIYRSDRIGGNLKNVTFRFVYRDTKKTVSQEEVDREHSRLTQETSKLLGKAVI